MSSRTISSNTKSCYPFLPRFDKDTNVFGFISNDLFIATYRPFPVHAEVSSLGQLLIYVQCGQRLATIDVPYERNNASRLQLLGFSSSFSIRALVRIYTRNDEVEVLLTEMMFDLELKEATITRQERILYDASAQLVTFFQPHEPWLLIVKKEWHSIMKLFEIDDFIVSELGTIDPGFRCVVATKKDGQLFLLRKPVDFNLRFPVLYAYALATGLVEIVDNFIPFESWHSPPVQGRIGCRCVDSLIVMLEGQNTKPLFVFDVSQKRAYEVDTSSCARRLLYPLHSGETLLFDRDGHYLQSIWLKPPALFHVAMKRVLMCIPAKTRDELHSTMIVQQVELLQFLAKSLAVSETGIKL